MKYRQLHMQVHVNVQANNRAAQTPADPDTLLSTLRSCQHVEALTPATPEFGSSILKIFQAFQFK